MEKLLNKHFSSTLQNEIINHYNFVKTLDNKNEIYNAQFAYASVSFLCGVLGDYDSIVSAIYYPYLKCGVISLNDIKQKAGENIAKMLSNILKIEQINVNTKESTMDSVRQMFIALAEDIRVIILKLCIEATKLKNRDKLSEAERELFLKTVNEIYAPLSATIGVGFIKNYMENELFKYYKPEQYKKLTLQLNDYIDERKNQIELSVKKISEEARSSNINAEVYGRHKELYSIYKKMIWKDKDVSQVLDILAVRVLVDNIDECYAMLGKIHGIYPPIEHFKDYIAQPKQNGYQSLHTTVIVENGDPLEIQIRTRDMHKYAEYGFASHVAYKEHRKVNESDQKLNYIRSIMELYKKSSNEDLIDALKTDVYSDKIFVQTPNGKVIQFPEGANPIDFAYAIHTKVGHSCVGCKINGKLVPITTPLNNGDVVEIITNPNTKGPSRDWLKLCKCSSTRSKINSFFKKEMKEENIKKGKVMLDSFLKSKSISFSKLFTSENLEILCENFTFESLDDVYASIGYGGVTSAQIVAKLRDIEHKKQLAEEKPLVVIKEKQIKNNSKDKVSFLGFSNLLTKFAQCCNPLPGDSIIGYVSRGKGVTIHRGDCKSLKVYESDRLLDCEWNIKNADNFVGSITLICANTPNVLAQLSKRIGDMKINICGIYTKQISASETKITIQLNVKDKEELDNVIKRLEPLSFVIQIGRNS